MMPVQAEDKQLRKWKERTVIEQLKGYKRIVGKLKLLEKTPIGYGMHISTYGEGDKLQALHSKLRQMPSYMYLSPKEQEIEHTAHAYLTDYKLGTKSQLHEVRSHYGTDDGDRANLRLLERKIEKVIEARQGEAHGYMAAIERADERAELESRKKRIDSTLEALGDYQPSYAELLRLRYIEGQQIDRIIDVLCISSRTFERWRPKALAEYADLSGIEE